MFVLMGSTFWGRWEERVQVTILYMNATSGKRRTWQPFQFCGGGYELWWLFISEPPAAKSKGALSVAVVPRWGPTRQFSFPARDP